MKLSVETFSKNLRRIMGEKNITQSNISEALHVTTSITSDWYNGRKMPRIDRLNAIADYLKVDPLDLLAETYKPLEEIERPQKLEIKPDIGALIDWTYTHPEYKPLFDALKKVKPEDMETVTEIISLLMRS